MKRGREGAEVIDLTLSGDEEEPPAKSARQSKTQPTASYSRNNNGGSLTKNAGERVVSNPLVPPPRAASGSSYSAPKFKPRPWDSLTKSRASEGERYLTYIYVLLFCDFPSSNSDILLTAHILHGTTLGNEL
jgi:hypothetical protein